MSANLMQSAGQYIRELIIRDDVPLDYSTYPLAIPSLKHFTKIEFKTPVTYIIGENGSGKSTLLEALAIKCGFNAEGGSRNFNFETRSSHLDLHQSLKLIKEPNRPRDGYFLRAESFFNVATNIEELDKGPGGPPIITYYGGKSLHEKSHGETFFTLLMDRLHGHGLYIFDEPEAALSPNRQLAFLARLHQLVDNNSQWVIATHSPILMAYPGATIYQLSESGIDTIAWTDTEHYTVTRDFLLHHDRMLKHLGIPEADNDH